MSGTYFKNLDIIRLVAVIGVFLFHLNILPGGFLAVAIFFVLSSFLSCYTASKKDKFSLLEYYRHLLTKIYFPMLIVIFLTLFIIYLLPSFSWLNLKPEVTSILLGYNNIWQLNTNLNYFAHEINSPFIHMWYIAILLQFDLVFPFIFLLFKKIGKKYNYIPALISFILTVILATYFLISNYQNNIMFTYYHTLTRLFPCFFGLFIAYLIPLIKLKKIKKKWLNLSLFYLVIGIIISFFITISSHSKIWAIMMIITTILTGLLIILALNYPKKSKAKTSFLKYFSKISYQIYLVQYPIIYFFQNLKLNLYYKISLIIILTLLISIFLNYILNIKAKSKLIHYLKLTLLILTCGCSLVGVYSYVIAKDYTNELKDLEQELEKNSLLLEEKQEAYKASLEEEEKAWQDVLTDMENGKEELADLVTKLKITGVGDSVMLGAITNLYEKFPNSYIDAQISRTAWVVNDILKDLKRQNILGEVVVLNLGANGDCSTACKKDIMTTLQDKEVFWINVTNDKEVHINSKLATFAKDYPNLHIIDWENISKDHPEYFVADKIHLTTNGRKAYTEAIYEAIYEVYLNKYETKINDLIKEHENNTKDNITFYGNDLLLNIIPNLENTYPKAIYDVNNDDFLTLKEKLTTNTLTNKIVFCYDLTSNLTLDNYIDIINTYPESKIYIINLNTNDILLPSNGTSINFSSLLKTNPNYLIYDKIHLSKEGNLSLSNLIKDIIK